MLKNEIVSLCSEISHELRLPMEETYIIIVKFLEKITDRTARLKHAGEREALATGIPPLDQEIRIHQGVTMMYSQPGGGRTSLAKRLAISACRQGMATIYFDVENKLMLHDMGLFDGIGVAKSYQESGLKELVAKGLVDCIVVDTITGLYHTSHESFLIKLRKNVPYIIVLTQMRYSIAFQKYVPAAKDHVLSSAHTVLYLARKEKQIIEGIDVMKIYYQVTKYEADRSREGENGSFIVRNNLADPFYTLYDCLVSHGSIRSVGEETYCQDTAGDVPLGVINHMNKEEARRFIIFGLTEMKLPVSVEVYLD